MALTEKRTKVYPKGVSGRFRSIRSVVSALLLTVYFLLPWLKYDGRQAVLFDIPERKFYVFDLIFWPQDVYYLAILLILLVIALFVFTAIAGRLWCGYACPQTVFTDIFMKIERLIEGERNKRIALDEAGLSAGKIAKKAIKHAVWLAFSFATAFAFVSYFVSPGVLLDRLVTFNLTTANIFWLGFFTFTTYGDCAFLRELMCLVPCPYGRFQSALFDPDTLIIGYDAKRGEPRGGKKDGKAHGDCVDCTLCVQVCPTGIDIRKGLQYECIACAQCIDACDSVMEKLKRPAGLIRYGSLRSIAGERTKVLRPRVIFYAASMVFLFGTLSYKLATRVPLDIEVLRDRTSLYQTTNDGRVSNIYTIKAMNKDTKDHRYLIKAEGIEAGIITGANPITVKSGEVFKANLALVMEKYAAKGRISHFDFIIEDVEDPKISAKRESTFLMPDQPSSKVQLSRK